MPAGWSGLKLVIAANIIDYSSARVIARLAEQPDYFNRVLREAVHAPLAIDCFEQFQSAVIEGSPKRIVWLMDNDGEVVFDLWLIQLLLELGHQIAIVGKAVPASNDVTLTDLEEIINFPAVPRSSECGDRRGCFVVFFRIQNRRYEPLSSDTLVCTYVARFRTRYLEGAGEFLHDTRTKAGYVLFVALQRAHG